ncbi:MAG: hypothetical protein PHF63_09040 [Herbinix sp.]|nr:hypothetical protein [Herbinix sp.]
MFKKNNQKGNSHSKNSVTDTLGSNVSEYEESNTSSGNAKINSEKVDNRMGVASISDYVSGDASRSSSSHQFHKDSTE